jgi:hypothetical protein
MRRPSPRKETPAAYTPSPEFLAKRQTGRTTRMLFHASALIDARMPIYHRDRNPTVYILAGSYRHAILLRKQLRESLGSLASLYVEVVTERDLRDFDWNTLKFHVIKTEDGSKYVDNVLLVDHWTIERKFPPCDAHKMSAACRKMLTAYDATDMEPST